MTNGTKIYWCGQLQLIVKGDMSCAHGVVMALIAGTNYKFSDYTFERVYNKEFV